MLRRLAEFLFRHSRVVLFLYAAATAGFTYSLSRVRVETIFGDLLPYTHPYVKVFQRYGERFGTPLTVFLMIEVPDGTIFNRVTLRKIARITNELDKIPGVNHNQVVSITSPRVKRAEIVSGRMEVTALVGAVIPESAEALDILGHQADTTQGVLGVLLSPDHRAALATATFLERRIDYRVVFEHVNEIVRRETDAGHRIWAAGEPLLTGWVYYYWGETFLIFGVGLLIMTSLFALYFRNIAGVVTPLVVGVVSSIWGFGFAGLLGYNLDPLVIVVPVLLIARALSHSVQMCARYFELYGEFGDVRRASLEAMISLFPPGVVGVVTDAAGIFAITLAPIRLIEKVGMVCGLWALSLILTVVVLSPLVLAVLPPPRNVERLLVGRTRRNRGPLFHVLRWITGFSASPHHSAATVAGFVALAALCAAWAPRLTVGYVTAGTPLLWPRSFFNRSVERINREFLGSDQLVIVVEGRRPDLIRDPRVLQEMLLVQAAMEESPNVTGTLSVADYVVALNRSLSGGSPKWEIVPADRRWTGSLQQMLYSGSSPGDWDRFFTSDNANASIVVWCKDRRGVTVNEVLAAAKRIVAERSGAVEGMELRLASGTIGLAAAVNEVLGRLQIEILLLISLVIGLATALIYRSVTAGLLLAAISNVANLMNAAVMVALGIGLDVNTLPIASVGMGIGIDYNIYLMSRMAEEYSRDPAYPRLIPVSIFTTGKAIFFTATTMTAGVGIWYFLSSFRFQAEMGVLLATVMLAHALLALFFQPAVMRILQPRFLSKGTLFGREPSRTL